MGCEVDAGGESEHMADDVFIGRDGRVRGAHTGLCGSGDRRGAYAVEGGGPGRGVSVVKEPPPFCAFERYDFGVARVGTIGEACSHDEN